MRNKFQNIEFLNNWKIESLFSVDRAAAVNTPDGISPPGGSSTLCDFGAKITSFLNDLLVLGYLVEVFHFGLRGRKHVT